MWPGFDSDSLSYGLILSVVRALLQGFSPRSPIFSLRKKTTNPNSTRIEEPHDNSILSMENKNTSYFIYFLTVIMWGHEVEVFSFYAKSNI